MLKTVAAAISAALCAFSTAAADFVLKLPDNLEPQAEICTFKYGKRWAYSFELGAGTRSATYAVLPLFDKSFFTDVPAEGRDGDELPFRGTLVVRAAELDGGGNSLSLQEMKMLLGKGWGVSCSGYWGRGIHWNRAKANDPDMYRRELYWGQYFISELLFDGQKAAVVFSCPGDDEGYGEYLRDFGLLAATVHGETPFNVIKDRRQWREVGRNRLDKGYWRDRGGDALWGLPSSFKDGDWIIDGAYDISAPGSDGNYGTFATRVGHIVSTYGKDGDNSVWAAPTGEVARYVFAARAAKISVKPGELKVTLPRHVNSSALTLKLSGIPHDVELKLPDGCILRRKDGFAYLTTPEIGDFENNRRGPRTGRVYASDGCGEGRIVFKEPIRFAALRIRQYGSVPEDYSFNLTLITPSGERLPYNFAKFARFAPVKGAWGGWLLFPMLPEEKAITISGLEFPPDGSFKRIEVYAVTD